jgi:hypothetical protein
MSTRPFRFDVGSKKLYPSERPIIDVVAQALCASAAKHGRVLKPGVLENIGAGAKRAVAVGAGAESIADGSSQVANFRVGSAEVDESFKLRDRPKPGRVANTRPSG